MKTKWLILPTAMLTLASCQTAYKNVDLKSPEVQKLDVQGHRGSRATHPENSIPAILYALEVGANTLEFDLVVTKDDVVVVNHDLQINPVICRGPKGTKVTGEVWIRNLTFEQLKQYDCGSVQNPRFPNQKTVPGTRIPSLEEVLSAIQKSKLPNAQTVLFNIETKSQPELPTRQPAPDAFVKLVLKQLKKFKILDRVTLQSFDHRTIVAAKKLQPQLKTSALYEVKPAGNWVEQVRALKADVVSPDFKLLSREDVEAFKDAGIAVIPWTANTPEDWLYLIDLGVNGIITDDPASLLAMLGRTSED